MQDNIDPLQVYDGGRVDAAATQLNSKGSVLRTSGTTPEVSRSHADTLVMRHGHIHVYVTPISLVDIPGNLL